MKHSNMKTAPAGFTERELRNSGIPEPGGWGAAKNEAWALALGLGFMVLIIIAAIIDTQL